MHIELNNFEYLRGQIRFLLEQRNKPHLSVIYLTSYDGMKSQRRGNEIEATYLKAGKLLPLVYKLALSYNHRKPRVGKADH